MMKDRREFLAASLGSVALATTVGCAAGSRSRPADRGAPVGTTQPTSPKVVRGTEGSLVWAMGILVTIKVTSKDTDGMYSVFEDIVPPGAGPVPHTHTREDETLYVLEGSLTAWLGGRRYELSTGDFVHMPRGVEHYFKNLTDTNTRMLLTYTPGGFEQWFLDVGVPVIADDAHGHRDAVLMRPPDIGPGDIERAVNAARRYGVEFVKPARS